MKHILTLLIATLFIVSSYAQHETRNVEDFSVLKINSAFEVVLTHGNKNEVKIEAPKEEYLSKVATDVVNGKLKISLKGKTRGNIKVYITYKDLKGIELSGASELTSTNRIKSDQFYIDGSGASEMEIALDVNKLKLDFSGASEVKLSGTATMFDMDFSGASELKAGNLKTEQASIDVSGAATIKVNVSKEIVGEVSGASSIHVKGKGKINIEKSGASYISRG